MKTYLKLCSFALLTLTGVISSQGAHTNVVQNLVFKLTAWTQGATTTNGSLVTVTANSQSIVTKDVLTWLGQATTNNFSSAQLLVINQLGSPISKAHVFARTIASGVTNNVDVSSFFGTLTYAPTVNSYTYNNTNHVINAGNYYGYWGFALLENYDYPALPVTFYVTGFGVDAVSNIVGKKKVVFGLADQFSVTNGVGLGQVNGNINKFMITGNISITGKTLETQP